MNPTSIVEGLIIEAVRDATGKFSTPRGTPDAVTEAAKVIVNQTNNEPWWQSRVTWGAIAAILGGLGTMAGLVAARDWTPNLWLTAFGGVGGGVGTLYGRWVAKKPLALPGQ